MLKYYAAQANELLEEGASPAAGGPRDGEVRHGDGAVPRGRPRRQRHRLGDPQAPSTPRTRRREAAHRRSRSARWGASGRRPARAGIATSRASATRFPDPVVDEVIDGRCARSWASRRARSRDEEIVERCVYALVNEGARILEERHRRARLRHRHGLPHGLRLPALSRRPDALRRHGGAPDVERAMQRYRAQTGDAFWEPAALLAKLAAEGKTFN